MKISVLISLYNSENLIKQTLESLLSQTFRDFEIILIDDYSNDKTQQVVTEILQDKVSFTLKLNGSKKGISNALNLGLEIAQGEFIALIDHDDIALENRFEKQVAVFESMPNIGVCGSWMQEFENGVNMWKYPTHHDDLKVLALIQSPIANPTAMIRRSVIGDTKYDEKYNFAQDYAFWLDLISKTRFYAIPEVLVKYRIHPENASTLKSEQQYNSWKKSFQDKLLNFLNCSISDEEFQLLYDMKYPNFKNRYASDPKPVNDLLNKINDANINSNYFSQDSLKKLFQLKLDNVK